MAHIGVLKVLEEVEIPIDYISGSCMGAIIGGLYSIGYIRNDSYRDLFAIAKILAIFRRGNVLNILEHSAKMLRKLKS